MLDIVAFGQLLSHKLKGSTILFNEPMAEHTSFRVGGGADIFIDPDVEEISLIIGLAKDNDVPVTVLGNGTNLLVGDLGIRGVVLAFGKNSSGIDIKETSQGVKIFAGAGELLSSVAKRACEMGYTGLEFATGIPGSVGGGVAMNAGAYGGEIKDCCTGVFCVDIQTLKGNHLVSSEECDFSYRKSIFLNSEKYIITGAEFELKKGDPDKIRAKVAEYSKSRKEKQPLEFPSAGSTFKRPEGYFAGKLIEDAGLKGFSCGGAMVSEKHAGFVINRGSASAKDIKMLIEQVTEKVYENSGVKLSPEVRFVGEF